MFIILVSRHETKNSFTCERNYSQKGLFLLLILKCFFFSDHLFHVIKSNRVHVLILLHLIVLLILIYMTLIKRGRTSLNLTSTHVRESGIRDLFACGIWNPGLWNPEYSSRNPESHQRLESRI